MPTISVFVSSTFRDFHAERDALVGPVRATLNDRLERLGCRVEFIDLRWGVGSADVADDDARQAKVLDVCLGEIGRSRPLFVGLIGDRYGWVPPQARLERVAAEAGLSPESVTGFSVTELEFEHGALSGGGGSSPMFFVRNLVGPTPQGWADDDLTAAQALRDRVIRHVDGSSIRHYQAQTDGHRLTDTTAFEAAAVDALGDLLEAQAFQLVSELDDPREVATRLFFEDRLRVISGRSRLVDQVIDAVQDIERTRGVCLYGSSGAGKSTVWCACVRLLHAERAQVVHLPIGISPDSSSEAALIRHAADQLKYTVPQDISIDELRRWWKQTIATAGPLVLALDALDSMDFGDARDRLEFLVGLPQTVRLLVTTTSAEQTELLARAGVETVAVPDLEPPQMANLVTALATNIHREIPGEAAAELVARPRSPLWLNLAVGELLALDEDDFIGVDPTADPVTELAQLVIRTVRELPDGIQQLVDRIIDRLERRFGVATTSAVLGALSVSRSGLTPADLAAVAGTDDLTVAGIRRGFAGMVVSRGSGQRLGFAHGLVRETAAARFALGDQKRRIHRLIAERLASVGDADAVRQDDLLWHQLHCSTSPSAADTLNALERPSIIIGHRSADGRVERAAHVVAAAFEADTIDESSLDGIGTDGIFVLLWSSDHCADFMRWPSRKKSADTTLRLARRLTDHDPSRQNILNLGLALQKVAREAHLAGDTTGASAANAEATRHLRALAESESEESSELLCGVLMDASILAMSSGDLNGATAASHEASLIARSIVNANPDDVDALRLLNSALDRAAEISETAGDLETAWGAATESLDSARDLLRFVPDAPQLQASVCDALVRHARIGLALLQGTRAHQSSSEAVSIARDLVAGNPGDHGAIGSLAAALHCHGVASRTLGDLSTARAAHHEAATMSRAWIARDGSSAQSVGDLATALEGLAATELALGDTAAALVHANEVLDLQRSLTSNDPQNYRGLRSVSIALDVIADVNTADGRVGEARAALAECVAIHQRLLGLDSGNSTAHRDAGLTLIKISALDAATGNPNAAIRSLDEAIKLFRGLCQDSAGARARRDLLLSLDRLGSIYLELNDRDSAMRTFTEAAGLCRQNLAATPDDADALSDLGTCLQSLVATGIRMGDLDMARRASLESVDVTRRALVAEPSRVEFSQQLIIALINHGSLCGSTGRSHEGGDAAREAVGVSRLLVAHIPEVPEHRLSLANNLRDLAIMCGQVDDTGGRTSALAEASALYRDLIGEPDMDVVAISYELATVLSVTAALANSANDYVTARETLAEQLRLEMLVSDARPTDRDFFRRMGNTYENSGIVENSAGDHASASQLFTIAANIFRELLTEAIAPETDRRKLCQALRRLGEALAEMGDHSAARAALQDSVELSRTVVKGADATTNDWHGHGIGLVQLIDQMSTLEDDYAAASTGNEAVTAFERVVALDPSNAEFERLFTLALFKSAACAFNIREYAAAANQALRCTDRWCKNRDRRSRQWPQLSRFLSNLGDKLERSDRKLAKKCHSAARAVG